MPEPKVTSSSEFFLSHSLIPIIVFVALSIAAWKLCKKASMNPYISGLVFILAIPSQGFGLLAFIIIAIVAGLKIFKAKNN